MLWPGLGAETTSMVTEGGSAQPRAIIGSHTVCLSFLTVVWLILFSASSAWTSGDHLRAGSRDHSPLTVLLLSLL